MATVRTPHCSSQSAKLSRSTVKVGKVRTGSGSRSGGTATAISCDPMSMPAASARTCSGFNCPRFNLSFAGPPVVVPLAVLLAVVVLLAKDFWRARFWVVLGFLVGLKCFRIMVCPQALDNGPGCGRKRSLPIGIALEGRHQ